MKMMYEAGGDMCQKEAKMVKCPTFILILGRLVGLVLAWVGVENRSLRWAEFG